MLDAKELADLIYADGLKKDDIDLQEASYAQGLVTFEMFIGGQFLRQLNL